MTGVRVGTSGAFDGTTQPAVHAAFKAKHAEVRNDNQVRDLHVLIVGKRPGETKLRQARLDNAFLIPFEEARKLAFLSVWADWATPSRQSLVRRSVRTQTRKA